MLKLHVASIFSDDDIFLRATSRIDLGIKDLSRHFICFSTLFREKNDSGMAAEARHESTEPIFLRTCYGLHSR
jgi:hypothetical protein